MAPVNVFLSYSHKDEDMRNELETHFAVLKRDGVIDLWHDHRITPGQKIDKIVEENLERSQLFVFLVSPYFLASDYCYEKELEFAKEKEKKGEGIILSIILEHCDWKSTPLKEFKVLPKDGKPITKWANIHEAFLDVTVGIRAIIPSIKSPPETQSKSKAGQPPKEPENVLPRSSNLSVRKEFNDLQKEDFLKTSFEYIGNFFEGSMDELHKRNSELEGRLSWIDTDSFEAKIFRDGELKAHCKVWVSRSGGAQTPGIAFSYGASAHSGSSFNQILNVTDNGRLMYFEPLMHDFGFTIDPQLTAQGGAEHLWSKFIEPLQ